MLTLSDRCCCWSGCDADKNVLENVESCIQDSASCVVPAAVARSESLSTVVAFSALSMGVGYAASCMRMYAVNLYFHCGCIVAVVCWRSQLQLVYSSKCFCLCCCRCLWCLSFCHCVESPPHCASWDQAFLFLLCAVLFVLGCYPVALPVLSSPGCFQDHCSATMKSFKVNCCINSVDCAHTLFCTVGLQLL